MEIFERRPITRMSVGIDANIQYVQSNAQESATYLFASDSIGHNKEQMCERNPYCRSYFFQHRLHQSAHNH